jgi:hypothetical protein
VAKTILDQPQSKDTALFNSTTALELQGMSGGHLNTVISLMSTYGISWIVSGNPRSLAQSTKPTTILSTPLISRMFGYQYIPGLGICTTSFLNLRNESIANRSAALMPQVYGPGFHLHEFIPVSNIFAAILVHMITRLGLLMLTFTPITALLKNLIPAPGTGLDLANAHVEKQVCFVR